MPESGNKKIALLRSCRLFDNSDDEELMRILEKSIVIEVAAGECVADENVFPRGLAVVASGELVASNRAGEKSADLRKIAKGGVFGAASMFTGKAVFRYISVIHAIRRTKIVLIPEETVRELIAGSPSFALAYAEFLTTRIRFLNAKIGGYTSKNAAENLKQYIAGECRASKDGTCDANYSAIARRLAVSRPTVYQAAEKLIESGFILKEGKKFRLAE